MSKANIDVFEAARNVADILKSVNVDDRKLVVRWVMEKLGDPVSKVSLTTNAPPQSAQKDIALSIIPAQGALSRAPVNNIKAFLNSKKPKNDVQLAATVAYYYAFEVPADKKKHSIGKSELMEAVRKYGRKRPNNPQQVLLNAKNLGYLDSSERGQFKINSVGENLVAMTLPGTGSKKSVSQNKYPVKRKKKSPKKEESSQKIKALNGLS